MRVSRSFNNGLPWWLAAAPAVLTLLALFALDARPADAPDGPFELEFVYGSEKEKWIAEATQAFNDTRPTIQGQPFVVKHKPMGSGDTVDELIRGTTKAHLISPASSAYLDLGNAWARARGQADLVGGKRQNLVLSPVVIAMWRPMAEALGWPATPLGWQDLRDLARAPDGWGSKGHPEWGPFKFGHTHPESSNSGLCTLLCEVYAANPGKNRLEVKDVEAADTAAFLKDLEQSVVHYGDSTGFFAKKMAKGGRKFLSAAVLYENLVIESYGKKDKGADELVAIYPKDGTLWSDHPVAVVERPWVKPWHREAAQQYVDFLRGKEQQQRAVDKYGFRPDNVEGVLIRSPIDSAHGADPNKPDRSMLREPPEPEVMTACIKAWHKYKKRAHIVLVLDSSYKMNFNSNLFRAQDGAGEIIDNLDGGDWISILTFNDELKWVENGLTLRAEEDRAREDKEALKKKLERLEAKGKRRLFDAVKEAHEHLKKEQERWKKDRKPPVIWGIIVLASYEPDWGRGVSEADLLKLVRVSDETRNETRICTFAFGAAEDAKHLNAIAEASGARPMALEGKPKPETVRKVLRELATFF
jgi:Ca-activated chloride channel family protein